MKTSIIHNNYAMRTKLWTKMPFKPNLKPIAIGCPIICALRNHLISTLSGNNIEALEPFTKTHNNHTFPSWSSSTTSCHIAVNTAFIYVYDWSFRNYFRECFIVFSSFLFITFPIPWCRFFKVMCARFNALSAPEIEPPKCSAISFKIAWGCSSI